MGFLEPLKKDFEWINAFFFGDPGLGSLFGGFGLLFWGLGFPAALYHLFSETGAFPKKESQAPSVWWNRDGFFGGRYAFPCLLWGQLILGLTALFLYSTSLELLSRSARLVLFVPGLGLVALGLVLTRLSQAQKGGAAAIKALCIVSAFLALVQIGSYRQPAMNLEDAVEDRLEGRGTTPYRYFYLGPLLEPLDLLSREIHQGIDVYVAGPREFFWTAPFYGLKIQNRIWNFKSAYASIPDAFVFHRAEGAPDLFYYGPRMTPRDVLTDPRYRVINHHQDFLFLMKQSLLEDQRVRGPLIRFYEDLSGDSVSDAKIVASHLSPDSAIVTSFAMGYVFRLLELMNEIPQKVFLVPPREEDILAESLQEKVIYTLGSPLTDYPHRAVIELPSRDGILRVFENRKKGRWVDS